MHAHTLPKRFIETFKMCGSDEATLRLKSLSPAVNPDQGKLSKF